MDDGRKQRGVAIAALNRIRKAPKGYIVPSQSGQGKYAVVVDGDKATCTCPDYELRRLACKHALAVEIVLRRETALDGTVIETRAARITYRQDWPAYHAAQTHEKAHFQALLYDLWEANQRTCSELGMPP